MIGVGWYGHERMGDVWAQVVRVTCEEPGVWTAEIYWWREGKKLLGKEYLLIHQADLDHWHPIDLAQSRGYLEPLTLGDLKR